MGNVLQMQPGAITDLAPRVQVLTKGLPANSCFILEGGQTLYFLGVSLPVGTCARGRRAHVAVFGLNEPSPRPQETELVERGKLPLSAFEVLCRALTEEEFIKARKRIDSDCLLGVEWLRRATVQESPSNSLVVFRLTGKLQVYVNLV